MMKKVLPLLLIAIALSSCNTNQNGQLPNVTNTIYREAVPRGMVAVERGAFRMGTPNDSVWGSVNDSMTVSIESFWMDQTEVTNYMYKFFVTWVKDSIMRERLAEVDPSYKPADKFTGDSVLNWKKPLPVRSKDPNIQAVMKQFYFVDPMQGKRIVNSSMLNYQYDWIDIEKSNSRKYSLNRTILNTDVKQDADAEVYMTMDSASVNSKGRIVNIQIKRPIRSYKDYYTKAIVNVYPDTTCWKSDFVAEKNDNYVAMYFSSPAYQNYPVVGVSWEQANAFCEWRTKTFKSNSKCETAPFRLPTEAEWEYAAKGGKKGSQNKKYPWRGDDVTDKNGCYFANFKPQKGDFTSDGYLITSPVGSFLPNELGLYDIVGNVAEWTSTAYFPSGNKIMSTMNPSTEFNALANTPYQLKKKVIRGGSFKDVYNFVNVDLREWKYQNEKVAFVGFRCVRNIPGEQ
ncbi:MAG: SUMF1/EgtB/PvdO family nonheme iron enzyme [Bacteroidales bacterium]